MKNYKIFTAGKTSGFSYPQQMEWRNQLEGLIRSKCDKSVFFIHPPIFYPHGGREAMEWDMCQIMDSDIMVVNLENISDSIGTCIELGIAAAMNMFGYKYIYVVGIGSSDIDSPWLSSVVFHREETLEDAAEYIKNYLLV